MDVGAIVVNYRTPAATEEGVRRLLEEMAGFSEPLVVVVDNASGDGSLAQLTATFAAPSWGGRVVVIDSGHNGGYGYGINVGVRYLMALPQPPRFYYIVNPDALVDPESLSRLVTFMDSHPDAGLVGSRVYGTGDESEVRAFRFPSVWSEIETTAKTAVVTRLFKDHVVPIHPAESCEVDWVCGASMLIRAEVFERAGLFDEGFFLYFEEVDFARRTRQAGFKVYYVAGAAIAHIGSLATGMNDESRRMPRYWFQARRRYFVKHHGPVYGAICDAAWIWGHAMFVVKAKLLRRRPVIRPRLWRDFIDYSVHNLLKPAPEAEENAVARAPVAPPPRLATGPAE